MGLYAGGNDRDTETGFGESKLGVMGAAFHGYVWLYPRQAADSVRNGETLADPLARAEVFPAMVTRMIAVGEKTGALETMLMKISDFYDAEVRATVDGLTSLIEPIMMVKTADGSVRPAEKGEKGEPSLKEKERVVVGGLQRIRPGMKVTAKPVEGESK